MSRRGVLIAIALASCRHGAEPTATGVDAAPPERLDAGSFTIAGSPPVRVACPVALRLVQHDTRAESVALDPHAGSACVELAQPHLPPEVAAIACVPLARPYFAEPLRLATDRCTDDGSSTSELRALCIGKKGVLLHVEARRDGDAIAVTIDGNPPVRWGPNACTAAGSYQFVPPATVPRFETIRSSWGRVTPSGRCGVSVAPPRTIDVVLRESMPATIAGHENHLCGRGARERARVELSIPSLGIRRDLGLLGNGCGSYYVHRLTDVNGVEVIASNMGISSRFVFAIGDRIVYLDEQDATETVDLPCGTQPRFSVDAPGEQTSASFVP